MKRTDLIRRIKDRGGALVRQGAEHEVWRVGSKQSYVPRYREINELTAKAILKQLEEEEG